MFSYIEILRPLNCLMSIVAVVIGGFLILNGINLAVVLVLISVFLITGAGNVVNDYVDVEADKINRPKRPIPSGRMSKRSALVYCIILFVVGILLTLFVNWLTFVIAMVNSLVLVIYSTHLQHKMFVGNAAVAYLTASTFLFGGAAALGDASFKMLSLPLLLMVLSGLSTFSREIAKDIEDVEGDKIAFLKRIKSGTKSLERFDTKDSSLKHSKGANYLAIAALILTLIVSPLPYLLNILGLAYLIVLIPTDLGFAFAIYLLVSRGGKKKYRKSQKAIKFSMFLGLIAFVAGVLFK